MSRTTSSKCRTWWSSHPRLKRYLLKYLLQPLLLLAMIAAVVVPTAYVFMMHQEDLEKSTSRITCLEGDVSESTCLSAGCLWQPLENGSPSCYYPPVEQHGYSISSQHDNGTAQTLQLSLLESSATPVPEMKQQITLQLIEYGSDMFRVRMVDPSEDRYEPPVPLQLPHQQRAPDPLYSISWSLSNTSDVLAMRVTRVTTGTVIFDMSLGGLTFSSQLLQVATKLPGREVYGLGEHAHSSFRHLFDQHTTWPMFARDEPPSPGAAVNLYGVHPVYYVLEDRDNAHAVFWLNSNAMEAELLPLPGLALRSIGGIVDLFFMMGPKPLDAVHQYTSLVGEPAMPPYWGLGFQLCRYGYEDLQHIEDAVARTRRHGVPQDVQYGDIDVMDRRLDFTLDPVLFQGLSQYVTSVKQDGLRFIVILDPAINAELSADDYPVHQRALAHDAYIRWGPADDSAAPTCDLAQDIMLGYVWPDNRTAFPDFLRSSTATWWEDEISRFHQNLSFDGLWIDMNEPANFGTNEEAPWNWPDGVEPWSLYCNSSWDSPPHTTKAVTTGTKLSEKTLCMNAVQGNDCQYRHYDVHNLYGWAQAAPTLRGLRSATGQRGLVISRSTFPSSGRWAGHWLGDNRSSWLHLANSIVGMLEFNLFGIPYIGADICGFFGEATEELCGRWMQLGAFYPFSRNHNGINEPDQDPGKWPSVAAASRAALRLRYLLLPHLYTLHYHAHTAALPVVRSMAFQFPHDINTRDLDSQFLWGGSLIVAPVLKEGASTVDVYFPTRGYWYCFHQGHVVAVGARIVTVAAPLEGAVPLFVSGGSILPTQQPGANTKLAREKPLGLVVAPSSGGAAEGDLFWDDGEGIDTIENGRYYAANFSYQQNESTIMWTVTHPHPSSSSTLRLGDVRVFNVRERPYSLWVNGRRITTGDWHYHHSKQVLELFDLDLPVDDSFTLSWSTERYSPLPCPVSYADLSGSELQVTETMCLERSCDWSSDTDAAVPCSLPSSLGYTIAGAPEPTATGYRLPLSRVPGPPRFENPIVNVTFEVFELSNEVLRFKLYDSDNDRYEVPMEMGVPQHNTDSPLYQLQLESDQLGALFAFTVTRRDTGTILFDSRLGGLVLEDQFLSVSSLLPSKNVYGLGENTHSSFRHRMDGTVWSIFSRDQWPVTDDEVNLYGAHPYYECIENDGNAHSVLLLNSNAIDYQFLDHPSITLRTIGGVLDLFMFLGPSPEQASGQYTALVGRPVMPPYWALGFQLSRYGYEDLGHIQEVVNRTLDQLIPLDVQYADIDHMDRRMDFTLDEELFGDLPSYVQELHQAGMRFIIILDPAINAQMPAGQYPTHEHALASDVYIKWPSDTQPNCDDSLGQVMLGYVWPDNKTAFPNWFLPATSSWWAEEVATFYQTVDFDGLWIDMNEPAVFDTNMDRPWNWPDDQPDPCNLKCPVSKWDDPPYVTRAGSLGPSYRMSDKTLCLNADESPYRHYDVHNLYGWAQANHTLRAVRAVTGERSIVISRSTFVGSGRWAGHWLGDNRSDWPDLHRSIIGMLEFNLFGIPYIGADICGFFGEATEELCGRWMQLGAFYPFSRNHNGINEPDQDPGMWPETVGVWSKDALEARYRLLPYLYTLFYEATTTGATVVRSLAHEFPTDRACLDIDDQFLWGSSFMISPVLTVDTTSRAVYFPHAAWYDYHTGRPIEWPGEKSVLAAPLDTILLHVRGGAILPIQEPSTTTQTSQSNPMGVLVALSLDRRASGSLFRDDLIGIGTIAANRFSRVLYNFVEDTLTMTVVANHGEDLGNLKLRDLEFLGIEKEPESLVLNGDALAAGSWKYNSTTMRLQVTLSPMLDMNRNMELRLNGIW